MNTKTMYEIELVRVDKDGAITFSNSENANFVDQLDEVTETLEEAQAVNKRYQIGDSVDFEASPGLSGIDSFLLS